MGWWKLKILTCLVAAWTRKNGWNSTSVVLFGIAGKGPLSVVVVHVRPFDSAAFVDYMSSWESHKKWNKQHDKISNNISFYINMAKKGIKTSVTKVSIRIQKSQKSWTSRTSITTWGPLKTRNKFVYYIYVYIYNYIYIMITVSVKKTTLKLPNLEGLIVGDRKKTGENTSHVWNTDLYALSKRPLIGIHGYIYMPYMAGLNKDVLSLELPRTNSSMAKHKKTTASAYPLTTTKTLSSLQNASTKCMETWKHWGIEFHFFWLTLLR